MRDEADVVGPCAAITIGEVISEQARCERPATHVYLVDIGPIKAAVCVCDEHRELVDLQAFDDVESE